jgi:hypothetical protein
MFSPLTCSSYQRRSGETDTQQLQSQKIDWRKPDGTLLGSETRDRLVSVDTEKFVGQNIPDYHRRVREGELLPSTYFKRFSNHGSSTGTYNYDQTGKVLYRQVWGDYTAYTDWALTEDIVNAYVPEPSTLSYYAQNAAAKIYNQGYDALTSLAELADTRKMFINLGKRLWKMKIPKKIFRNGKKAASLKSVANDWMEGRYGWRTLVYDITSLNDALRNFDESRTRYSERSGDHWSTSSYSEVPVTWSAFYGLKTIQDQVSIQVRGSVAADIEVPKFQFNPLQTGWEVIPFSFVIDWFLGVGRALSALSFLSLQRKYVASVGSRITVERTFTFDTTSFKTGYSGDGVHQTGSCKAVLDTRHPWHVPIFPLPSLHINTLKIADLGAMIIQKTRRR